VVLACGADEARAAVLQQPVRGVAAAHAVSCVCAGGVTRSCPGTMRALQPTAHAHTHTHTQVLLAVPASALQAALASAAQQLGRPSGELVALLLSDPGALLSMGFMEGPSGAADSWGARLNMDPQVRSGAACGVGVCCAACGCGCRCARGCEPLRLWCMLILLFSPRLAAVSCTARTPQHAGGDGSRVCCAGAAGAQPQHTEVCCPCVHAAAHAHTHACAPQHVDTCRSHSLSPVMRHSELNFPERHTLPHACTQGAAGVAGSAAGRAGCCGCAAGAQAPRAGGHSAQRDHHALKAAQHRPQVQHGACGRAGRQGASLSVGGG
jgi:hypothetical protein